MPDMISVKGLPNPLLSRSTSLFALGSKPFVEINVLTAPGAPIIYLPDKNDVVPGCKPENDNTSASCHPDTAEALPVGNIITIGIRPDHQGYSRIPGSSGSLMPF
jgi:hypothetical protein